MDQSFESPQPVDSGAENQEQNLTGENSGPEGAIPDETVNQITGNPDPDIQVENTDPGQGKPDSVEPISEKSKKSPAGFSSSMKKNNSAFKSFPGKSDGGVRKMTYLLALETLLLMGVVGFAVFMVHKTKKTVEEQADQQIKKINNEKILLNNQVSELGTERERLKSDIKIIENDLTLAKKEKDDLLKNKEALENQIAKFKTDNESINERLAATQAQLDAAKTSETEFGERVSRLVSEKSELEKLRDETAEKLAGVKKEYEELLAQNKAREQAELDAKQKQELQYMQYAFFAKPMIEQLNKVNEAVVTGVTFIQFQDLVNKNLIINFKEFEVNVGGAGANSYSYLSFQLITTAVESYQESLERWRSLIRFSNVSEIGDLREKTLKFEMPIISSRPWLDSLQILWQQAELCAQSAGLLVEAKEKFNPANCAVCNGKHYLDCPKCNQTGKCLKCDGKGLVETKDTSVCLVCEGSGRCDFCYGKKSIPCPVCLRAGPVKK